MPYWINVCCVNITSSLSIVLVAYVMYFMCNVNKSTYFSAYGSIFVRANYFFVNIHKFKHIIVFFWSVMFFLCLWCVPLHMKERSKKICLSTQKITYCTHDNSQVLFSHLNETLRHEHWCQWFNPVPLYFINYVCYVFPGSIPAKAVKCETESMFGKCLCGRVWQVLHCKAVKDKWWEVAGSLVSDEQQSGRHLPSIESNSRWLRQATATLLTMGNIKMTLSKCMCVCVCVCERIMQQPQTNINP